jgi:hypothetical protein
MNLNPCFQFLQDADGFEARCIRQHGIEHSHHDEGAREAVIAGRAVSLAAANDYVAAHGCGRPTRAGFRTIARCLMQGMTLADAAFTVVYRGQTTEART